jgi:RecJ-like exonuclease
MNLYEKIDDAIKTGRGVMVSPKILSELLCACDEIAQYEIKECSFCDGSGKTEWHDACPECGGYGRFVSWTCLPDDVERCKEIIKKVKED